MVRHDSVSRLPAYPLLGRVTGSVCQDITLLLAAACMAALLLVALFPATALPPSETYLFYAYCVLVIRAWTYEYAQGRMSIHVYCVLVVRTWTYEYGLNQMYVGGVCTGNRPPVSPP